MWWLCHPVSVVILRVQRGHRPPCCFQRWSSDRFPFRLCTIFTSSRFSKYVSHSGSYGLASLRILTCLSIGILLAFSKRIGCNAPSRPRISPENTQFFPPLDWQYFSLCHCQGLCGGPLLSHSRPPS